MAPRAHWKGYLKLSLVSCPINLYPAVSAAEKVSFRQINSETGHRLRQQLVDFVTGDVVERHNTGRGYEVGENQFVRIDDEELAAARTEARTRPFSVPPAHVAEPVSEEPPRRPEPALKLVKPEQLHGEVPPSAPPPVPPAQLPRPIIENTRTIELDRFIPRDQLDPRYYATPYYIAPRDLVGQETFAVLRDAMARQNLVGMGRIVLANRERPLIVEPMELGLRGIVLRYAHEVRAADEYFADIPPMELPDDLIEITETILNMKRGDFDPSYLEDRYRTVLVEKLREKRAASPARKATPIPSHQNVVNLMDVLKRSLAVQKPPAPSMTKAKPSTKRSAPSAAKRSTKRPSAKGRKTS